MSYGTSNETAATTAEPQDARVFESLGRVAVRYLQDQHDGDEYGIDHYLAQVPDIDPGLVRNAIEMAAVLHQLADGERCSDRSLVS